MGARSGAPEVAPSTLSQALAALLFLYREILRRLITELGPISRARAPVRLPVVLTQREVRVVLDQMQGHPKLVLFSSTAPVCV